MANIEMNISQVNADFQAIKNKIKDYTEVADGTRTSEYANKIDDVYKTVEEMSFANLRLEIFSIFFFIVFYVCC